MAEQVHPCPRSAITVITICSAAADDEGDAELTGSQEREGDPPMWGRKSVLIGMLTSGFVISNAAESSNAIAGGTSNPIPTTQPPYASRWIPITAYARGQQVVSPNNDVVSATVAHKSSATYESDTLLWALSPTYVPTIKAQITESTPVTLAEVVPVTTGHAPFEFRFNSFSNHFTAGGIDAQTVPDAGDYNHAMHWGFNPGRHNGGGVAAGVPGWFLGMEDRWPDPEGDGTTGPEFYLEYTSPDGTSVPTSLFRPLFIRLQNGWDNTATNKSVQTFFDIGQGPSGSFGVWGGIQNGHQLLSLTQSTFATYMATMAHLGNRFQLSPLSGQATMLVKAPGAAASPATGAPDYVATIGIQIGAALKWSMTANNADEFMLIDQKVGRQHGYFLSGADSTVALSRFKSKADVEGILSVGSATATPTLAATSNSGTSPPTPTIVGNAARGIVKFGTGSGVPSVGAQVTVTLPAGYTGNPVVVVSGGNDATAAKVPYVIQPGDQSVPTNAFQICLQTAPATSQATGTYLVSYIIIG